MAAPRLGVSKQQLLLSVPGYADAKGPEALDRMFERDKAALKAAGVQLEVLDGDGSDDPDATKYRIAKGVFDWPKELTLNPQKLQLLELAAKAWNQQSMRKNALAAITRLKSLGYVAHEQQPEIFSPRILARHASFTPLAEAAANGLRVQFDYQKPGADPEPRELDPIALRLIEGQWVLLAGDDRKIKNFLLRRIVSEVKILEEEFKNYSPTEISQAESDLRKFANSQRVEIQVSSDSEAHWHFGAPKDGRVVLHYMDRELLIEDLSEFGNEISITEPSELHDYRLNRLQAVISAHA
jgi:proteasome accessory factor B